MQKMQDKPQVLDISFLMSDRKCSAQKSPQMEGWKMSDTISELVESIKPVGGGNMLLGWSQSSEGRNRPKWKDGNGADSCWVDRHRSRHDHRVIFLLGVDAFAGTGARRTAAGVDTSRNDTGVFQSVVTAQLRDGSFHYTVLVSTRRWPSQCSASRHTHMISVVFIDLLVSGQVARVFFLIQEILL